MQLSISIEPYIGVKTMILTQYLDEIVKLRQKIPELSIHFDYFRVNEPVLNLLKKYTDKIDIYVHLMNESIPTDMGFKVISQDVTSLHRLPTPQQGLVFDLGCPVTGYEDLVTAASYITVMSVKCGQSGQLFQESALNLLPQIRALNPRAIITLDGGINETNIKSVRQAGVDIAVVGSYAKKCYEAGDLLGGLNRLLHD